MLNKIIAFSVNNKLIIGLFVIALIGYGAYETTRLPVDAVPDITNNQVQVITVAPALGAPDIERLITFPVEQVNSNIPGLKEIRSFSRFGLSVVTIVFGDEVDIYWARQQVTEKLQQAKDQIPSQFGVPALAPVTTGLGEIYQYAIRPKEGYEQRYTLMQLRSIQDWIIRRQLLGVKGVADVASFGGELKQYEVAVDPARLKASQVTMEELFTALEKNNQNTGGAYIEKGPSVLFIRSEGLAGNMDDIRRIVIKNLPNGVPLLVGDVAELRLGHATRYGAMTFNDRSGLKEVSGAVVMMLKGANSNEVIRNIKDRIALIRKSLPEGIVIEPFLDRTKMVNNAIGTVTKNLAEGALIVIFILVIFLGNLRAGLLVASIIPLSMLFAIIMMNLFGVSGNLMSLGALDFGLIVDGAVIIVEAVMHRFRGLVRQEAGLSREQMDGEVKLAAGNMMNSAVFGQIIILIVYLPIFTLQGIEGKMFKPMAQTVAFALLGAFLLSLTYIPMMSALVLSRKQRPSLSDRILPEAWFRAALQKAFRYYRLVLGVVISLFLLAVLLLTRLGGEFIPTLEEGDYAVDTRVLTGSSLQTSMEAVSKASDILLTRFPEVERIAGKTGSSEIPTDPMPPDASDMIVVLKDKSKWTSAASFPELESKMRAALEAVPGVTFSFQFPVQMRFNELMTGARQDIVCKIFGENLDTLARYARVLGDLMGTVKGSSGIYVEAVTGMPQIVIRYDRTAVAQYGLSISDINRAINTAFAGESSGLVYEGEQRYDLVVRLNRERRKDFRDVEDLLIPTPQGLQIPLRLVANVTLTEGPNQIQREDAHRRIVVGCNVRGRDVQSMVKELQRKADGIHLPPGYFIRYGGAFENLEAAKKRLSFAVPVSLALIFLLLYFAFHSVRQGLLIFSAIPLSATGGIFALVIRDMPFSISAGVGFIALFGVAVLNGIVLLSEYNRRLKEHAAELRGGGPQGSQTEGLSATDLSRIILDGTATRLRPVLMTALVASLGFLPMALSRGAGAEVQRPLATVVIGGLMIATFLTLFVLPILFYRSGKRGKRKRLPLIPASIFLIIMACLPSVKSNAQEGGLSGFPQGNDRTFAGGKGEDLAASPAIPITLQAAIDTALKNNLSLRGEKLNADYLKQLRGTAYATPGTSVAFEYGQMNSAYTDNKLMVMQTIRFPTVYARERGLYEQEWKTGLLNVVLKEAELKRQVSYVYFNMLSLLQKRKLLEQSDSLFRASLERANLRFRTGESNVLEKITAETQVGQINMQLQALVRDLAMLREQFRWLLHTDREFIPAENDYSPQASPSLQGMSSLQASPGMDSLADHPLLRQLAQQQETSEAKLRLAKARLLPDLFAGYNNMTMKGDGADGKSYTASTRFQSVQLGLNIPLFAKAQRSAIAAEKTGVRIAENNYAEGLQTLTYRFRTALEQYRKSSQAVSYYESTALKNADTIVLTADRQFIAGSINYLEWVMLMGNAISIRNEYIQAGKELNLSIVELNYLTGNSGPGKQ